MGRDDSFVNNLLKKNDVKLEDVFYAFYKKRKVYIIKRNDVINV